MINTQCVFLFYLFLYLNIKILLLIIRIYIMISNELYKPIIIGTSIGCCEHIVTLPLRSILDHQQLSSKNQSILSIFKSVYSNNQNQSIDVIKRLYKGTSICLVGVSLGHISLYSCLEYSKNQSTFYSSLLGVVGRVSHDLFIVPGDTVRMVSNVNHMSIPKSIQFIKKQSGWKGFYKGFIQSLITTIPSGAIEFTVLSLFRNINSEQNGFIIGGIAGCCTSIVVSPIDTIKTICQAKQVSIREAIIESWYKRGWKSLFQGSMNRVISTSLAYGCYEYCSNLIKLDEKNKV